MPFPWHSICRRATAIRSEMNSRKFFCKYWGRTISLCASSRTDAMFSEINFASSVLFVAAEAVISDDFANKPFPTDRQSEIG